MGDKSLCVEIIGVAGSGKSTLVDALVQRSDRYVRAPLPKLRGLRHMPFALKNGTSLLPIVLQCALGAQPLSRREIKRMLHLNGWHRLLRRQAQPGDRLLLDHGPLYMLASLQVFGPPLAQQALLEAWWQEKLEQWAHILDGVVWLNAPAPVLIERINTRRADHLIKGQTQPDMTAFLERYHQAFVDVVMRLPVDRTPLKVVQIDSHQSSADEICDEVIRHFGASSATKPSPARTT